MGKQPITEITRKDIIKILQQLKENDLTETAHRVFMLINKVYMYAVTTEKLHII